MYATINGTTIFFDVHGLQYEAVGAKMIEKPVTFCLHGGPGGDHTDFVPWTKPLEKRTQMVMVDHRSTGRSSREKSTRKWNIEQFADDVEELRKYLGLGKICVMGDSFGGMWALVYATRYPKIVEKLVLVDTKASWKKEAMKESLEIVERRGTPQQKKIVRDLWEGRIKTKKGIRNWLTIMDSMYYYRYDKKIGREINSRAMWASPQLMAHMDKRILPKADVRSKLKVIKSPTLIIVGRHDWICPVSQAKLMHRSIRGSKLVIFEKSGHSPFVEENAKFLRIVGNFLMRS